jgi:hypothetical protein
MTNFQDPDFIKTLLKDLGRILKSNFPGNTIIDRMELVCGQGYNLEKAEAAARSTWVSDPVHPSNHSFATMARNLLEAMRLPESFRVKEVHLGASASAVRASKRPIAAAVAREAGAARGTELVGPENGWWVPAVLPSHASQPAVPAAVPSCGPSRQRRPTPRRLRWWIWPQIRRWRRWPLWQVQAVELIRHSTSFLKATLATPLIIY